MGRQGDHARHLNGRKVGTLRIDGENATVGKRKRPFPGERTGERINAREDNGCPVGELDTPRARQRTDGVTGPLEPKRRPLLDTYRRIRRRRPARTRRIAKVQLAGKRQNLLLRQRTVKDLNVVHKPQEPARVQRVGPIPHENAPAGRKLHIDIGLGDGPDAVTVTDQQPMVGIIGEDVIRKRTRLFKRMRVVRSARVGVELVGDAGLRHRDAHAGGMRVDANPEEGVRP